MTEQPSKEATEQYLKDYCTVICRDYCVGTEKCQKRRNRYLQYIGAVQP